MVEIIKEKEEWDALVGTIDNSDFYHTYDYHLLSKDSLDIPALFVFKEKNLIIALPLLLRHISDTDYFDATSVYGYPGPITKNIPEDFDNTNYRTQLKESLLENNIVSIFSRLNPFVPLQDKCLENMGHISSKGIVVNIDMTLNLEEQTQQYQKRLKTQINKAYRELEVITAITEDEISQYIDIYHENMRRVHADKKYFFKKEYFFDLVKSPSFKTEILLARLKSSKEITGGAMFVKKNKIMQYHLSGAKEKYLNLSPIKLLIDKMRIKAKEEGCTYFNLGGGVGSNVDSLFKFKSNFSKDYHPFKLWNWIIDETIYDDLVHITQSTECQQIHKECSKFFPCYRCTIAKNNLSYLK